MIVKVCKKHGDLTIDQCLTYFEKRYSNPELPRFKCKLCNQVSQHKYVRTDKGNTKRKEYRKVYDKLNRPKLLVAKRIYKKINRDKINQQEKERRAKNIEVYRASSRKYLKKHCDNIGDPYVKGLLARKFNISMTIIPLWMIELKREIIKLRREARKQDGMQKTR